MTPVSWRDAGEDENAEADEHREQPTADEDAVIGEHGSEPPGGGINGQRP